MKEALKSDKEKLAIHESGHAVYAYHIGCLINYIKIDSGKEKGETSVSCYDLLSMGKWGRDRLMEYSISGYTAECLHIDPDTIFTPDSDDYQRILELNKSQENTNDSLEKVIKKLHKNVMAFLKKEDNMRATMALSDELIVTGYLSGKEAKRILDSYTKP